LCQPFPKPDYHSAGELESVAQRGHIKAIGQITVFNFSWNRGLIARDAACS
jgi:hypothetical protein